MSTKKREDRIKSATCNSPHDRKLKEGTPGAISNDGKQSLINIWPEWSEIEVNNEKWDGAPKTKEKEKNKSPQMTQNMFDDPDGLLRLPPSLKPFKWKRSSEYFTKNPVIVDTELGVHKFDIFSMNEHLFVSETMRWIICQINNLWITSSRKVSVETDNQIQEFTCIDSEGTYHTWRFWEHIYALNKVGKGFPQYYSYGKYYVKLFWMGKWRKIMIDDMLPFDENDQLLLPITSLKNELWPIILTKALLKIASLSYGYPSNDTEFGDFSVIHSLTGWIPQKKVISKEHHSQIWNDLQKLLHHWIFPDGNSDISTIEKIDNAVSTDYQYLEGSQDKTEIKEVKDKNKKDIKDNKQKEKKEKNKPEKLPESQYMYENPETLIFASYTSTYNKLNMISSSKMSDHSEALRKIGVSQIYSHPVLLNFYRDCPLVKPKSPEVVPSWKLIRPLNKVDIPKAKDCFIHNVCENQDNSKIMDTNMKFIELQSLFLNYNIVNSPFVNFEEDSEDKIDSQMNNDTLNIKSIKEDIQVNKDLEIAKTVSISHRNLKYIKSQVNNDITNEEEITKMSINDNKRDESNFSKELTKTWIDIEAFFDCFQVIHIYHKTETYRYSEIFSDTKNMNNDQKEPIYLYTDNTDSTEIIFCLSVFCKWFTTIDNSHLSEFQVNYVNKDASNNLETISTENDFDNLELDTPMGTFIAESHNWKSFKIGKCFKRTRTNGTKAISLKFPPGRHCLRIFIQSPNGFYCKLISQNSFHFGNEDDIIPLSIQEPKRILDLGLHIIDLYNNIIKKFSNIDERKLSEKSFFSLVFGFKTNENSKVLTANFTEVFNQCLLKNINQINKELVTTDLIFALKAINLDFHYPTIALNIINKQNNSNRNSAKIPTSTLKGDNRKQSSTKSVSNNEVTDEKRIDILKEYSQFEKQIIFLQKIIRGYYVRKVMKTRDPQSIYHIRTINELNKIFHLIELNTTKIGMNILNEMIENYPQILKYYKFENDKLNHICLQEFGGTSYFQPENGYGILFREIFHVNSINKKPNEILIKVNTAVSKCTLTVINNDNGEIYSESVLKILYLLDIKQNANGYTLIASIKFVETSVGWKLKLIYDGRKILPTFLKPELCNDFSTSKIIDYYVPEENGLLFQQMVKVKIDHLSSILVKLSNPDIPIRLSIFNFEEEVCFAEGIGEVFIQSFIFLKDQCVDDQTETSNRSPSRTSNKSKKNKDKIERYSAKNSRTNSSCSTEDNKVYKYSIQAFINPSKWLLSKSNEEFVEKLRQARKKDSNENRIWNDGLSKSVQNSELPKKESNQKVQLKNKAKEKGQESSKNLKNTEKSGFKNISTDNNSSRPNSTHFESDKANWMFFLYSDTILEDNIQIFRNNQKYDNLCAIKKVWLEIDSLRFERGKQIQMKYNEENQVFNEHQTKIDNSNIQQSSVNSNCLDLSLYYPMKDKDNESYINPQQMRYRIIELYRQQQLDWNSWYQTEKAYRIKKINENLNVNYHRQKIVDSHRLDYFKARENIKQCIQILKTDI